MLKNNTNNCLERIKDKSLNWYQSKIGLLFRGIVAAVPGGGTITEICNGLIQSIDAKRVEQLLNLLDKRVANMEEPLLKNKYLDSDWNLLLEHAIIKARLCSRNGQIQYISNIIFDVLNGNIPELDGENLIDVISELNGDEALFFGLIGKKYYGQEMPKYGEDLLDELGQKYKEKLTFLCSRLEARGLIKEITESRYSYSGGSYVQTYMGQLLIRNIRDNER